MSFTEIILLCIALSMDCFAICIVYGAQRSAYKSSLKEGEKDPFRPLVLEALRLSAVFIFFHLVMIGLGWGLGYGFMHYISAFDHWLAFGLLAGIGIKMILESFNKTRLRTEIHALYDWKSLLLLGLATSIDAFAIGVSLSLSNSSLTKTCLVLPLVLLIFASLGLFLGFKIKKISLQITTFVGGLILLGIGLRILLEHEYGFTL